MRFGLALWLCVLGFLPYLSATESAQPFGAGFPNLDSDAVGEWWNRVPKKGGTPRLLVPREDVVAFALYTHDRGVLKLTCQLYPLKPDEPREVHLEFKHSSEDQWQIAQAQPVIFPGWSSHSRVEDWDNTKDVQYRVRLGDVSSFEGLIRKTPSIKTKSWSVHLVVIVVGHLVRVR